MITAVAYLARHFRFAAASLLMAGALPGATAQTAYSQVSAGDSHACAVTNTGQVHCWGQNSFGKLGNGDTVRRDVPVPVRGIATATQVSAGLFHSCARQADGSVKCWGNGADGALGNGDFTSSKVATPFNGVGPGYRALQVGVGAYHTCVLAQDQFVFCAGRNDFGQSGSGFTGNSATMSVAGSSVSEIAIGAHHSCSRVGGAVYCWGANDNGQLGDGTSVPSRNTQTLVPGVSAAIAIAAGRWHTCALVAPGNVIANSSVKCWGNNSTGQLGDGGSGGISRTAVTVANLGSGGATARAIAAGTQHTCALLTNDTVQCWGANAYGAIGDGTFISTVSPKTVVALQAAATGINSAARIATGNESSCAVMSNGGLRCWGMNEYGQGGHGHGGVYQTTAQYVAAPGCALDIDGDSVAQLATDGALLTRALKGLGGTAVSNGTTGPGIRTTWALMRSHLERNCGVVGLAP